MPWVFTLKSFNFSFLIVLPFFKDIVLFSSITNVSFFIVPPFYGFISFSIFSFRMLFYFEFLNVDSCSLWIVSSCILLWDYLYWGFFGFASTSCFREITNLISVQFSSVQLLSRVRLFASPWTAARQASLSITNSQSLFKLMSIESVMPSNYLILSRPFSCLQSFPASGSFQMSQFFASGGKSIEVSASASLPSMNIRIDFH